MWALIRGLRYRALAVAFFVCYVLPNILVWLVFQVIASVAPEQVYGPLGMWSALFALWAVVLSPLVAGYLAARIARVAPLAHGVAVSIAGVALYLIALHAIPTLWLTLVVIFMLLAGLSGAWFYRFRAHGVAEL